MLCPWISPFRSYLWNLSQNNFLNFSTYVALVPDKPTNLAVSNITSKSAEISWIDPRNQGRYRLSRFWIKLKKENFFILSISTGKVNKYKVDKLTPYTTYEISVAAGNYVGFGKEIGTLFLTSEESEGPFGNGSKYNMYTIISYWIWFDILSGRVSPIFKRIFRARKNATNE